MSVRASRWLLWIGLVLMLPVPILVVGPGWVPPARLLMLGGIAAAVALLENARGAVVPLALFLLVQGLLHCGVLWLVGKAVSPGLRRLSPAWRGGITLGLLLAGLVWASAFDVYETPYAAHGARSNLLRVFR